MHAHPIIPQLIRTLLKKKIREVSGKQSIVYCIICPNIYVALKTLIFVLAGLSLVTCTCI